MSLFDRFKSASSRAADIVKEKASTVAAKASALKNAQINDHYNNATAQISDRNPRNRVTSTVNIVTPSEFRDEFQKLVLFLNSFKNTHQYADRLDATGDNGLSTDDVAVIRKSCQFLLLALEQDYQKYLTLMYKESTVYFTDGSNTEIIGSSTNSIPSELSIIKSFLHHQMLNQLCSLYGVSDNPRRVMVILIGFSTSILRKMRYFPILSYACIYKPISQMITSSLHYYDYATNACSMGVHNAETEEYHATIDIKLTALMVELWKRIVIDPSLLKHFIVEKNISLPADVIEHKEKDASNSDVAPIDAKETCIDLVSGLLPFTLSVSTSASASANRGNIYHKSAAIRNMFSRYSSASAAKTALCVAVGMHNPLVDACILSNGLKKEADGATSSSSTVSSHFIDSLVVDMNQSYVRTISESIVALTQTTSSTTAKTSTPTTSVSASDNRNINVMATKDAQGDSASPQSVLSGIKNTIISKLNKKEEIQNPENEENADRDRADSWYASVQSSFRFLNALIIHGSVALKLKLLSAYQDTIFQCVEQSIVNITNETRLIATFNVIFKIFACCDMSVLPQGTRDVDDGSNLIYYLLADFMISNRNILNPLLSKATHTTTSDPQHSIQYIATLLVSKLISIYGLYRCDKTFKSSLTHLHHQYLYGALISGSLAAACSPPEVPSRSHTQLLKKLHEKSSSNPKPNVCIAACEEYHSELLSTMLGYIRNLNISIDTETCKLDSTPILGIASGDAVDSQNIHLLDTVFLLIEKKLMKNYALYGYDEQSAINSLLSEYGMCLLKILVEKHASICMKRTSSSTGSHASTNTSTGAVNTVEECAESETFALQECFVVVTALVKYKHIVESMLKLLTQHITKHNSSVDSSSGEKETRVDDGPTIVNYARKLEATKYILYYNLHGADMNPVHLSTFMTCVQDRTDDFDITGNLFDKAFTIATSFISEEPNMKVRKLLVSIVLLNELAYQSESFVNIAYHICCVVYPCDQLMGTNGSENLSSRISAISNPDRSPGYSIPQTPATPLTPGTDAGTSNNQSGKLLHLMSLLKSPTTPHLYQLSTHMLDSVTESPALSPVSNTKRNQHDNALLFSLTDYYGSPDSNSANGEEERGVEDAFGFSKSAEDMSDAEESVCSDASDDEGIIHQLEGVLLKTQSLASNGKVSSDSAGALKSELDNGSSISNSANRMRNEHVSGLGRLEVIESDFLTEFHILETCLESILEETQANKT